MHVFTSSSTLQSLAVENWWTLTPNGLEKIAATLLGEKPGGWVRAGDQFIVIANLKLGALASKLNAELSALSADTKRILDAGNTDAALRAAAFYHLRFENIHPLREGNGRVGRVILAAQLNQVYGVRPDEFLQQFHGYENEYKLVFASGQPPVMLELMVDLLAMLTGQALGEDSIQLPASILPLHPDRRPLVKNAGAQNRLLPPARPPQRNNYYRKFR